MKKWLLSSLMISLIMLFLIAEVQWDFIRSSPRITSIEVGNSSIHITTTAHKRVPKLRISSIIIVGSSRRLNIPRREMPKSFDYSFFSNNSLAKIAELDSSIDEIEITEIDYYFPLNEVDPAEYEHVYALGIRKTDEGGLVLFDFRQISFD